MCVFKFGILPLSTVYERFFLNRFHNHFQHAGWCGFSQDYDDARCQKTVAALKNLGAEEAALTPHDGEASLQALILRASAVKKKFKSIGDLEFRRISERRGLLLRYRSP